MIKIFSILLFCSLSAYQLRAQLPKENAQLNFRIVGFSFPADQKVSKTTLEIATGNYLSVDSFKKNIIISTESKGDKIITEVPSFGAHYTWRAVYIDDKSKITFGSLHHFSTATAIAIDTQSIRLLITKPAGKYKDAYVFLDGNKALYDMNGKPLWFLPDIDGSKTEISSVRDLKESPLGTITFLLNDKAYETDLNGNVLWQGPNNKNISRNNAIEAYHHEFTRLSNGHYMLLGTELESWKLKVPLPAGAKNVQMPKGNKIMPDTNGRFYNKPGYVKRPFGTVMEYDEKGGIVWSWKSVNYFKDFDYYSINPENGMDMLTVHENAFYLDEKDHILYLGFRDISRVVKIKYPEGTVLNTYGEIYRKGVPEKGNPLFCGQHSCRRSKSGYLYVFSNGCDMSAPPKIVMMKEPVSKKDSLRKIWEYVCPDENRDRSPSIGKYELTTGGNAIELPDNSLFVSTTTKYSSLFIVDHDKNILWSALPEKWDPTEKKWNVIQQYRASIITSKQQLEQLVWNSEK